MRQLYFTLTTITAITTVPSMAAAGGLSDPIEETIEQTGVTITLETIANGMTAPNWAIDAPGDAPRLFATDQDGIIWAVDLQTNQKSVFHDVGDRIVELGAFGPGSFDERGLLGVAFHPDYQTNGLLYTYESHPTTGEADFSTIPQGEEPNHQTVITEWEVPNPGDPNATPDANSARELLRIDQPQFNHNAGAMNFGADGLLYIALGDGGMADDQGLGHPPQGNAQDITTILGNILRIDPLGDDSANGEYGIPQDNPFVGQAGVDEIYATGFRNPFRFSFDTATDDLWVGDAGQNDIEEVDVVTKGGNYGWRIKEGTFLFEPAGPMEPGFVTEDSPGFPPDLIDPVAQYDHDEGVVVVGGFVYRGFAIPQLHGRYVFGEHSDGGSGRLFHLTDDNTIVEFQFEGDEFDLRVLGFGQDANGEVYVLANEDGLPFGDNGVILKIVPPKGTPPQGDLNGDGAVNGEDLGLLLGTWNSDDEQADLNNDGIVDESDLGILLGNWSS